MEYTIAETYTPEKLNEVKAMWSNSNLSMFTKIACDIITQAINDLKINLSFYERKMKACRGNKLKFNKYKAEYQEAKTIKEDARNFFLDGRFDYLVGGFNFSKDDIAAILKQVKTLLKNENVHSDC